jgi:ubiquinone/menaquinone biosynthesis C-methylase UbiE
VTDFANVYEDARRAEAYAQLEFPGTYYLAYRDLPDIIRRHATGQKAVDFGCGAGRSTRFLTALGFDVVGVDIAEDMLRIARDRDPNGRYVNADETNLGEIGAGSLDLVQSIFTFDNVPTAEQKSTLIRELAGLLNPQGRIVNLVSSPEIYTHEWASFSTKDFPGNFTARTGDYVYTMMLDVEDRRPVQDVLWPDEAYRETYRQAGLEVVEVCRPLGRADEPFHWVSETTVAPWVIYVLKKR